jgi:hypothetical protein
MQQLEQSQPQHNSPAVPPLPPMPASPEMEAPKDAPVSRSMSRYHRRQPTLHATTPSVPPVHSNTLQAQHVSSATRSPPRASRYRAASSPYQPAYSENTAQHRPRTAKQRADTGPPSSGRQQAISEEQSARQLLQKERERQRLLKEKYEAEARAHREAKQAELERLEMLRKEEEEAALQEAQRQAEEAELLKRQKEERKAEQERGKRLRKAEAQKVLQQREQDARRSKEESERKLRHEEERARKAPSSSPPVSPPRHDMRVGLFKRRKDDGLTTQTPAETSKPPQLSLSFDDLDTEVIRPGGGGIVLGIDAPTSAVNAGERVSLHFFLAVSFTDCKCSVSQLCAAGSAFSFP